jgi:hypothetical protein
VSAQDANLAAVKASGGRLPPVVYAGLLARLTLTPRGARYLSGARALDARAAGRYGYRSADGERAWAEVGAWLARTFSPGELRAAGFPPDPDHGTPALPFCGRFPALVIPFRRKDEVIGLRFRNLLPDHPRYKHNRYRSLSAARPPWPYNADAFAGEVVFVIEGELNAETLRQHGESAVGTYSAGIWLPEWTPCLAGASRIVAWFDSTDPQGAGDRGVRALHERLVAAFGAAWVAERWVRITAPADANELHRRGELARVLAAALRHASPQRVRGG